MHVIDAAHATVHDYPGGSVSLGPRLGMSAAILRNKVNPNNTTHHLTLVEAMRLVALTGDKRILHAMALEAGDVLVEGCGDLPDCEMAVLESMTAVFACAGQLGAAVHEGLADKQLTAKEFKAIEREAYSLRARGVRLVQKLERLRKKEPGRA